ncbi:MAG: hypothetical protein AAGF24_16150 [Cyanobacteria bacterium P01_H01_bin.121]
MTLESSQAASLPELFQQLRSRYPNAGLTAELLHLETDYCIVRAVVRQDGQPIATSMATAITAEEAEDHARLRVLALVGIGSGLATSTGISATQSRTPAQTTFLATGPGQSLNRQNQGHSRVQPAAQSVTHVSPKAESSLNYQPASQPITTRSADLPAAAEPHFISSDADAEPTDDSYGTDDWSEELAHIDLEIRRLGWSKAQEAAYLKQHFQIPSRDHITDYEELVSFLSALRSLNGGTPINKATASSPSPIQPWHPETTPHVQLPTLATPTGDHPGTNKLNIQGLSRDVMLDDVLAECRRLGWKSRQGSDYLQRTYGKPTRRELNNEELLEFLRYLRSQPSPQTY